MAYKVSREDTDNVEKKLYDSSIPEQAAGRPTPVMKTTNRYTGYQAPNMPTLQGFNYTPFSYGDYQEGQNVVNARNALNSINNNRPADWTGGQYGDLLRQSIDRIANRDKFSYDLNGDMLYQQYKDQYVNLGRMAMMDTMGQAAAMTGGYGNSYASTAGNQAYQGYLQQLNDRVPELYQLAYDRYNKELQDMYDEAGLYNTMYNTEYGQYRDTVSDWQTDRNFYANQYENERAFDYGQYSDSYNRALSAWNANTDAAYRAAQLANSNAMSRYEMQYQNYQNELQRLANEAAGKTSGNTATGTGKTNATTAYNQKNVDNFVNGMMSYEDYNNRSYKGAPDYMAYAENLVENGLKNGTISEAEAYQIANAVAEMAERGKAAEEERKKNSSSTSSSPSGGGSSHSF